MPLKEELQLPAAPGSEDLVGVLLPLQLREAAEEERPEGPKEKEASVSGARGKGGRQRCNDGGEEPSSGVVIAISVVVGL